MHRQSTLVAIGLLLSATQALAQGDANAGKTVFENQFASCHSAEPGKQGFGPSLAGVIGRQSGALPGYNFTPAMVNAHLVWGAKTLDEFLTSSTQKVPGTSMPVSVPDATARTNVIAYLGTTRS
jgi:cytochrome c2